MDKDVKLTIPDYVTLSNALLGFLSITYIIDERLWSASIIIIVCVALDGIDGALARFLDSQHEIGAYIDSFSDLISFGFAPALLLYTSFYDPSLGRSWQSPQNALATLIPFILVFMGTLRLARFADKTSKKSRYSGTPTPALALIVIHISYLLGWSEITFFRPYYALLIVGGLTPFLYCNICYPKLRTVKRKVVGSIFLISAFIGFLFILHFPRGGKYILVFTLSVLLGYVFISPLILKIHGRRNGKDG